MGFLGDIWNGLKGGLELILRFYEGLLEPVFGLAAWGIAIILLTVTVRIFMIPLMVRQTKSMRAMQTLQPELKKIQEKYKADRSMMKTDPERYKKLKDKQREAQMALYQEHQVNPVGGCLPLLLQMPVFFALFQVLQGGSLADDLASAPFLGIDSLADTAQGIFAAGALSSAGLAVAVLILVQVGTTYWSQKQMMARNSANAAPEQAQVQKMMLYVMPLMLGFFSYNFPVGVVLYWVTTNFWTMGQQAFIFRQVEANEAKAAATREEAKVAKAQRGHVEEVTGTGAKAPMRKKGKNANGPSLAKGDDIVVETAETNGSKANGSSGSGRTSGTPAGAANGKTNGSRAARRASTAAGANGVVRKAGTGRPRTKATDTNGASPSDSSPNGKPSTTVQPATARPRKGAAGKGAGKGPKAL